MEDITYIYPTNILLHKMGLKDSTLCDFCQKNYYIEHFFWSCSKLTFWGNNVKKYICRITGNEVTLEEKDIMLGYKVEYINEKVGS